MVFIPLRAKLYRPPIVSTVMPRPRLLQHLQRGLTGKVTLVSAPAGFGKSTLVSAWLDQLTAPPPDPTASPAYMASWLSLDESDNQLPRFVHYVVAAIEECVPQSCRTVAELLQDKPEGTVEALADTLVVALNRLSTPLVLVLDDLHLVNATAVFAFLARLVRHAPPQFHLVVITRVDPPLPLNRWRARGDLNELRLHDLCFDLTETTAFLRMSLAEPMAPDLIAQLHHLTEGWVVGLRMAVLAMRDERDYAAFVTGFAANSNRYIIDYLMDDVLDQQPPSVQQFLICTSILTRFCAALCASVVEVDEATAQQHISHIEHANLFLIELTFPVQWYRYHHQFQSMLLSRLHERYEPQAIAALHRLAAAWLAAHGQVDEALRHLMAIDDMDGAARLVEEHRVAALNEQNFHELEAWLAFLPERIVNQRPQLLISQAWVQHYRIENAQCLATTQRAADLLCEQDVTVPEAIKQAIQAEILVLYTSLGTPLDQGETHALIQRAWAQIRPNLPFTHSNVVAWLIALSQRLGMSKFSLEIGLTAYEEATDWPHSAKCRLLYACGVVYWYECKPVQAERTFQQGLLLARQHHVQVAEVLCQFGLAMIASARNQKELAETLHLAVVNAAHTQTGLRTVLSAYSLIRIYAERGRLEAAHHQVDRLKESVAFLARPFLIDQVAALEAYLCLLDGRLSSALRWAFGASHNELYSAEDRIPVIRVRILLAEGSPVSLEAADQILQALTRRHEAEYCGPLLLETHILQALVYEALGEREAALDELGQAVQIAVTNGCVGPLIDEGQLLKQLLYELGKRPEHTYYVQLLLVAFPADHSLAAEARVQPLPEPLTDRELDVLLLLASRFSNKEIAQQLIVSPHTVRNHMSNIFGKLQVENRFEAVKRASALGLLSAPN